MNQYWHDLIMPSWVVSCEDVGWVEHSQHRCLEAERSPWCGRGLANAYPPHRWSLHGLLSWAFLVPFGFDQNPSHSRSLKSWESPLGLSFGSSQYRAIIHLCTSRNWTSVPNQWLYEARITTYSEIRRWISPVLLVWEAMGLLEIFCVISV